MIALSVAKLKMFSPESEIFLELSQKRKKTLFTGAQPKAGTPLEMQTVRFFNVTLLGIYRWFEIYIAVGRYF